MCINLGGGNAAAQQQLAMAQEQQKQAQAAIAQANLDTQSSRTAAEAQMRNASLAKGFQSTMGFTAPSAQIGLKQLFGQ